MRWRRRARHREPELRIESAIAPIETPFIDRWSQHVTKMLVAEYGNGVVAGMKITLDLCLGIPATGGTPYTGEHTEEFRLWAQSRLRDVNAAQAELDKQRMGAT